MLLLTDLYNNPGAINSVIWALAFCRGFHPDWWVVCKQTTEGEPKVSQLSTILAVAHLVEGPCYRSHTRRFGGIQLLHTNLRLSTTKNSRGPVPPLSWMVGTEGKPSQCPKVRCKMSVKTLGQRHATPTGVGLLLFSAPAVSWRCCFMRLHLQLLLPIVS